MWRSLCGAAALMLAGCGDTAENAATLYLKKYIGTDAAGLVVKTLEGQPAPLAATLLNRKPVVLNVWATWCAPCLEELPALEALGQKRGVTVVAVATDAEAAPVKAFLDARRLGSGVIYLWDAGGDVTARALGARALPATYVLDVSGTVRMVAAGTRAWDGEAMRKQIEAAAR